MKIYLLKKIKEHFSIKLFVVFGLIAFLISGFFTGIFLFHQNNLLNTATLKKGLFQVKALAHNARIGVFAENKELLDIPVEAISHEDEVLEVLVFNIEGELLKEYRKQVRETGKRVKGKGDVIEKDLLIKIGDTMAPVYFEDRNGFEFWAPILSRSNYALPPSPGLDDIPQTVDNRLIGYAMVKVGKELLNRQRKELLITNLILLIIFLTASFFASYFVAKGIAKPLNRLMDGVNAISKGLAAEKISVETRDEIGLLAEAFNDMAEALNKREDELKAVNQKLTEQHEQRKMLSKRLIDLLEKDREQVAMELHDHVGQILTSLKINLEIIQGQVGSNNPDVEHKIIESKERAIQAIRDIKDISRGLKPSVLSTLGLISSIKELLSDIEINTGMDINLFTHNIPSMLSKEKELAIYRITQEAMNNIVKHTHATTVHVSLVMKGHKIALSIEDNGTGFDPQKIMENTHGQSPFGLLIMQERAEQLNGEFSIESETGKGTYLFAEIPV
ncbi:MAG: HAMP domain-containing protein [Deltaproteobacteria bacterium]|nr:HAMP domain-containing protein [Deltaproteobacteria bacterium]